MSDEKDDPNQRKPHIMPPAEAAAKVAAHAAAIRRKNEEAAAAVAAADAKAREDAAEAVTASTDQIVEQLNLVGGTLDQIDASEDAESADALIDRGLEQAINALSVLAEQPLIADQTEFAANLPQPAVDAEAVDQYLAEVLHNPDEFATHEARLVADSGGQPGPSARVEQHLISHIIDARGAQNVQVNNYYVSVSPEQIREAAEKLNRAKSLPKHRKKRLRLLVRSFQMLAGAAVTLVDIPAAAAAVGVISMALGTGMVVDAYSKIVDEVLPDDAA